MRATFGFGIAVWVLILNRCHAEGAFIDVDISNEFDCGDHPLCDEFNEMQRRLRTEPGFKDKFDVVYVTEEEDRLDEASDNKSAKVRSRVTRSTNCPVYTNEHLQNPSLDIRERSLSPWKWEVQVRPHRIPSETMVTACCFVGCIDPISRTEVRHGLASRPMYYEGNRIYVKNGTNKRVIERYNFTLGCRCDIV